MRLFEKTIGEAGLNYRQEIRKQALIILVAIVVLAAVIIYFGKYLYLLFVPMAVGLLLVINYIRYNGLKYRLIYNSQKEFIKLFTYFEIYIRNGLNIYKSFESLITFSSPAMKSHLETLLAQIDDDKTIMPYVRFSKRFQSLAIEQLLICIFQMVDQGNDDLRLIQFQNLFGKITEQHYQAEIAKMRKGLDSLNVMPLIGAGLITMMITLGIISYIGEIVSGI
ncbi:MAG: hypothetical protein WC344_03400 [Bacilli bacterium]|jgi:hypothetical protein